MSHPHGYDPHDARPTQVFPPREDGTAVLPAAAWEQPPQGDGTAVLPAAAWEQPPQGDGTAVLPAAAPRRASSRPVASRPSPATPAPAPPATRVAQAPVAGPPAGYASAQRPAVPQSWDASSSGAPRHAPGQGGQPAAHGRPARGSARGGTEPTAVAALVTGIFGFVVPLLGILAIVLGGVGLDRTRRRGTGGRGMAATGVTFGSIQVVFTALVVIAGLWFWNTYGDDVEAALAQAEELSQTDLSVPDLLLGGLTGDLSFGDLQDLAGTLGDADQLQDLGGQCQAGDAAACDDLLGSLPDGIRDQLPEDLRSQLPSGS